jgi:hypothetical protein
VVEHPLGKGEVECSIHSGSTSLAVPAGIENSSKIELLSNIRMRGARELELPASAGTKREMLARVARFWHARRTGGAVIETPGRAAP